MVLFRNSQVIHKLVSIFLSFLTPFYTQIGQHFILQIALNFPYSFLCGLSVQNLHYFHIHLQKPHLSFKVYFIFFFFLQGLFQMTFFRNAFPYSPNQSNFSISEFLFNHLCIFPKTFVTSCCMLSLFVYLSFLSSHIVKSFEVENKHQSTQN